MKTSIEITDVLLNQARQIAAREGTTVRALVEEGLRTVLARRSESAAFRLRDVSFKGDGLAPGVDWSWDSVRDLIYGAPGV